MRKNKGLVISTWIALSAFLVSAGGNVTVTKVYANEVNSSKGAILTEEVSKVIGKGDESVPEKIGYEPISQNDKFIMYFNPIDADIMILDKESQKEWTMIPNGWEEDALAKGALQMNLASAFIVEVYDSQMKSKTVTSYAAAVKKKNFKYNNNNGKLEVEYNLKAEGIKLIMEFYLTEDGFSVRIPVEKIEEGDKFKINKIKIMPFFGAAKLGEEGYLLIPDGSGALVDFSNTPSNTLEYSNFVYGRDESLETVAMPNPQENFSLPVFGLKNGDNAFIGIAESGDYNLIINSGVAGSNSSYYRAYSTFEYRQLSNVQLFEDTAKERSILKLSPSPVKEDMVINYNFINGDKANYSGMAESYRENLLRRNRLNKSESEDIYLDLTFLGGLEMKDNLFGVPYDEVKALTSFEDANRILKDLNSKGIENINIRYRGINDGGYMSKIANKFDLEKNLGSKKDFEEFLKYTEENNINVILETELLNVYEDGNSFKENQDAVRSISNSVAIKNQWNPVTKKKDKNNTYRLLAPDLIKENYTSYVSKVPKEIDGVSIDKIGKVVYSQGRTDEFMNRGESGVYWDETLSTMAETQKIVSVEGTNGYVLPYATNLTNMPMGITESDIETRAVPFYQMVVHGYIPYSSSASNFRSNSEEEFLKMIEYGALPSYEWIAEASSDMKNSKYNNLVSGNYSNWIDDALAEYEAVKETYKDVADQTIVKHDTLSDGVNITKYSNGISIVVNYNNSDYEYNNKVIKAKSYTVVKEGE